MVNSLAQEADISTGNHFAYDGDVQWLVRFMKRLNRAEHLSESVFWLDAMCNVETLCNQSHFGCDNHIWQKGSV